MTARVFATLPREARGTVFVENLIAFLPVLGFAMSTWQMIELWAGDLIIRRAASAAARAAVVVLPDDPHFYRGEPVNSFSGDRKTDIELAAAMILAISPHFQTKPQVEVSPASAHEPLTATVTARYRCLGGWISLVCGGSERMLTSKATFPFQGADYKYE